MYTFHVMKTNILAGLLLVILAQPAWAISEATFVPPEWPEESTFEFAILDNQGNRRATAYYRILQEESEGRPTYRIKYVGRNEDMQESSECVVFRRTLKPLRSSRKVISGGLTFFQDVAYGDGEVIVRSKYEGQKVDERTYPVSDVIYDYEELMWIIPQLDFSQDSPLTFNLFSTFPEIQTAFVVTQVGKQALTVKDFTFDANLYTFNVSLTPYLLYTVMQDGIEVPARIDMGNTTFLNMRLDPKKTGPKPAPDKPKENGRQNEPPGSNPLGPPPPGSKY